MFLGGRIPTCLVKHHSPFFRFSSTESSMKTKIKHVAHSVSKEVKSYALTRYMNYVSDYEKLLEARFPRAMRVYRVFSVGIKDFYHEIKSFVRIKGIIRAAKKNGGGIYSLASKDIEVYYRMPTEMMRVAPVLLISALPFANYIVFPVAYYFPKQLLSSHFWSLQQRHEFALQDHKKCVQHFRPLFRCMQDRVSSVYDYTLRTKLYIILSKLASGVHPSVEEVLEIRSLFQGEPFHLNCLYPRHKNQLLKIYGMHTMWSRGNRLSLVAEKIHNLDKVLARENLSSLIGDDLRWACFTRGLNPTNMRTEDMTKWLEQWLTVSLNVCPSTYSLLLHCPILLAFNQPTNRMLIQ